VLQALKILKINKKVKKAVNNLLNDQNGIKSGIQTASESPI